MRFSNDRRRDQTVTMQHCYSPRLERSSKSLAAAEFQFE
jgi:hypothetical protein